MVHDSASDELKGHRTGRRFGLIVLAGSVGMFLGWCVFDFLVFRFARSRGDDLQWLDMLLFLFPIPIGFAGAKLFRHVNLGPRIGLVIGATTLAIIIAMVLVYFVGLPFHVAIGGRI